MKRRAMAAWMLVGIVGFAGGISGDARGQDKPAADPGNAAIGGVVEREVKGLTSEDFPERQAAVKRLESLIAEQMKQRAEVQEIVNGLMTDLAKQQHALAMVNDEEAQAQIAGLLEMERGLAGWTIQTMAEPLERRKELLAWGLGKEGAPAVARAYSQNKRTRLDGVKQLAKMEGLGASWTLSRLINDEDGAVRATAMAAAWVRKPTPEVVEALWYRAVAGPQVLSDQDEMRGPMGEQANQTLKVEFPEGEPMEFGIEDDANEFGDAILAGDVLVHLESPLVAGKVRTLIAERSKAGKTLASSSDPDWTLVTHRLVEAYAVKEAVPLLATEALGTQTEEMGGDANGRPYMWSQRTMAVGVLCKLLDQDPSGFQLMRVRETGDLRGWTWGTDMNPQAQLGGGQTDGVVVRAFYTWWKAHHAEYGVKEEPSAAAVPQDRRGGRRGRGGAVGPGGPAIVPGGPAIDVVPVPAPEGAPTTAPSVNPPALQDDAPEGGLLPMQVRPLSGRAGG